MTRLSGLFAVNLFLFCAFCAHAKIEHCGLAFVAGDETKMAKVMSEDYLQSDVEALNPESHRCALLTHLDLLPRCLT